MVDLKAPVAIHVVHAPHDIVVCMNRFCIRLHTAPYGGRRSLLVARGEALASTANSQPSEGSNTGKYRKIKELQELDGVSHNALKMAMVLRSRKAKGAKRLGGEIEHRVWAHVCAQAQCAGSGNCGQVDLCAAE
jgi:hypothetical protein